MSVARSETKNVNVVLFTYKRNKNPNEDNTITDKHYSKTNLLKGNPEILNNCLRNRDKFKKPEKKTSINNAFSIKFGNEN